PGPDLCSSAPASGRPNCQVWLPIWSGSNVRRCARLIGYLAMNPSTRISKSVPCAAAFLALVVAAPARAAGIPPAGTPGDWQQFGSDPRHSGFAALETTLRPGNVATLHRLYLAPLPGTVDDAPVFLSSVATPFGLLDVLYMTTTDGQL